MIEAILSWGVAVFSAAILVVLLVILVRRDIRERAARKRHQHQSPTPFHDDRTTQGGFGD